MEGEKAAERIHGMKQRERWRAAAMLGGVLAGLALGLGGGAVAAPAVEPVGQRIALVVGERPPVTLYFEEQGAGPPLLLLHGLGESSFTWHEIAPALAARFRVVALDLKGFGRSEKPDDGAYAADDQAALVARFLIERNLLGVTLIGHSFGGTVALRTALAEGIAGTGRIRRIAVIGAPALPRSTPRYFDVVKAPLVPDTLMKALSPEATARLLLGEAMGGRKALITEPMVEGYAAPYRDPAAMTAFLATARAIVAEDGAEEIARRYATLDQPTLIVWCRKDDIVPLKSGRRLKAAMPRAELVVLEGCHHLPQHERPRQLIRTLGKFLASS
jgi:pimeloyl-ACP methyl ester carboxylesterase